MSWEAMQTGVDPCACGAGTETNIFEVDDWNRTRNSTEIHCPICFRKRQEQIQAERNREGRREWLLRRAQELVSERYSVLWVESFAGMTKKAAWLRYTGGVGYPTLGTFYQHVNESGSLKNHLVWCLTNDLEHSMGILGVVDDEINEFLKERKQLWKPTSKSM